MKRMRFESKGMTTANIEKIAALFPGVVTEGKVNFDLLRLLLGEEVYGDEAYEFTWVGKRAAIAEAGRPIRKTLRPCREESKNWDFTENLYIEGDNLDVLKLLQESYLGKVKMIYIDPPYNTGNDFIFRDNFTRNKDEYDEETGVHDENCDRLFRNTKNRGRFHSDWCSMMYTRLVLARNLLGNDGVIFASINDGEVAQLKKICDEVFGERNFVSIINWKGRGGRQDSKHYAVIHEYILCYAKNVSKFIAGEEVIADGNYPKYDEAKRRCYKTQLARKWGSNSRRIDRPNLFYSIPAPDGTLLFPMLSSAEEGCWRWAKSRMERELRQGNIEFSYSNGQWVAYEKVYAPIEGEEAAKKFNTWIDDIGNGTEVIKNLFGFAVFDYPKSPELLSRFIQMAGFENDEVILDFFSGSATTAHAVMQLNAVDGGKRKFIMVQLQEPCPPGSEAFKAGYKNIAEIGRERICRAGEKIKADNAGKEGINDLDTGFRVLKLDSSNMRDVYYTAGEYSQEMLFELESNIKDDRTDLDLLYACLLEWGLLLSMPHTHEKIDGVTVHTYNDGDLIACFDKHISDAVVKEIARRRPLRAVFRDSSFANSPDKINVGEIFKLLAPNTSVKVM